MSIRIDANKLMRSMFARMTTLVCEIPPLAPLPEWDGTYWVNRLPSNLGGTVVLQHPMAFPIPSKFKTVGKVGVLRTGRNYYVLFTEPMRGGTGGWNEYQGFEIEGTSYLLRSRAGGVMTDTILTGQNWTVERTLEIEHTTTYTRGWVDGAQVGNNTTNISTVQPRYWFVWEMMHTPVTLEDALSYCKPDDYGRLFVRIV